MWVPRWWEAEHAHARCRLSSECDDAVTDSIDTDDRLVQLWPATAADHDSLVLTHVPDGEILGQASKGVLLDAVRALGFR